MWCMSLRRNSVVFSKATSRGLRDYSKSRIGYSVFSFYLLTRPITSSPTDNLTVINLHFARPITSLGIYAYSYLTLSGVHYFRRHSRLPFWLCACSQCTSHPKRLHTLNYPQIARISSTLSSRWSEPFTTLQIWISSSPSHSIHQLRLFGRL